MGAIKSAIVKVSAYATPPLFVWACIAAYAERGYIAVVGEAFILLVPFIVAGFMYTEED